MPCIRVLLFDTHNKCGGFFLCVDGFGVTDELRAAFDKGCGSCNGDILCDDGGSVVDSGDGNGSELAGGVLDDGLDEVLDDLTVDLVDDDVLIGDVDDDVVRIFGRTAACLLMTDDPRIAIPSTVPGMTTSPPMMT